MLLLSEVPKTPVQLRMTSCTNRSWTLEWNEPFGDGVWIDAHELQFVRLPDSYLPGGSVLSSHEFDSSSLPQQLQPCRELFMTDAVEGPWCVLGNHYSGHTIAALPPWTAYRCRVRVQTIVGWSDFSSAVVIHTAGSPLSAQLCSCFCSAFRLFSAQREHGLKFRCVS